MSKREMLMEAVPTMSDRVFNMIWNAWQEEKAIMIKNGYKFPEDTVGESPDDEF
jgi:hypothetical protein